MSISSEIVQGLYPICPGWAQCACR